MQTPKNVLQFLENSAARVGDKTAVKDDVTAFTYTELLENSRRIGSKSSGFHSSPKRH